MCDVSLLPCTWSHMPHKMMCRVLFSKVSSKSELHGSAQKKKKRVILFRCLAGVSSIICKLSARQAFAHCSTVVISNCLSSPMKDKCCVARWNVAFPFALEPNWRRTRKNTMQRSTRRALRHNPDKKQISTAQLACTNPRAIQCPENCMPSKNPSRLCGRNDSMRKGEQKCRACPGRLHCTSLKVQHPPFTSLHQPTRGTCGATSASIK